MLAGGTTKISLIDNGKIRATTALNIGARLVAYDGADAIVRLEKGGRRFLSDLGQMLDFGAKSFRRIANAARDPDGAGAFRCGDDEREPWEDFYVTAPLGELPAIDGILFSGGVSEYIYCARNRRRSAIWVRISGERFARSGKTRL